MVKRKFCISSLLTESAGVMKSKLFPMQTKDSSGFKYILLFFNRMILNSGRHTQTDPLSCRVRSLGGEEGAQKQTTHQETKTKLSSATPNREKTIHCQRKQRKKHPASNVAAESAPHPRHVAKACDNNTQTIPNNIVLWQRLATCRRARDLQSATVFPGILPFRYTCKSIAFVKAA